MGANVRTLPTERRPLSDIVIGIGSGHETTQTQCVFPRLHQESNVEVNMGHVVQYVVNHLLALHAGAALSHLLSCVLL